MHFKELLTKAYGNVNPKQVARNKIGKLPQYSLVESYAHKFQTFVQKLLLYL